MTKTSECRKCGGAKRADGGCNLCELFSTGAPPGGQRTTTWPMTSKALAVHPRQVAKANARNKKHGINVVYDKSGDAHIPDRGERRRLLRLEGMHDQDGGYGD